MEYIKDWAIYAVAAMGIKATHLVTDLSYIAKKANLPTLEQIQKRFEEHIAVGIAVNTPATGPFGLLLPEGVKRGWIERKRALDFVFSALDASVRPGDRKVWVSVLNELSISDEELCAHTDALIPLLAMGDPAVVTQLAPVLIAKTDDTVAAEVLLAAFSVTTKKAKQLVLKSALNRPHLKNVDDIAPWLGILANNSDKTVASLAERLMKQWSIMQVILPDEKAKIHGLWQDTPPLWQVPAFEMGEVSPVALTDLAAELVGRPFAHDVTTERFLAMANAVAYNDAEAARTSLRGLKPRDSSLLDFILHWVKKEKFTYGFDRNREADGKTLEMLYQGLLSARDYMVVLHLDELPCVLSTPSAEDLSINLSDLIARLKLYKEAGIEAQEADFQLALTRLDMSTKTQELTADLRELDVPVMLQSSEKLPNSAGQIILKYLDDPIKEVPLVVTKWGDWDRGKIKMPNSLQGFPMRFDAYSYEYHSIFPLWGDAAMRAVHWNSEVYHEKGLTLRQVARRATPLPPGASVNILAAQRSHTPTAAEDATLAVNETWERGLLRPGVADASLLDWNGGAPYNIAALAQAFDGIIQDGLLSVVWPIIDELITTSLAAPRLLTGTAEFVELVATYLPEVQFAIKNGKADEVATYLPGIRALAQRSGSSRAVVLARDIAAKLPEVKIIPKKEEATVMNPPFDEVWIQDKVSAPIDDGVSIAVDWSGITSPSKLFLFKLTLPDVSDKVFHIVNNGWVYGLEHEGQCNAYSAAPDAAFARSEDREVWLHWDSGQKAMLVCKHRNWAQEKDSPLSGVKATPLPESLLTVIIGLLAQDGNAMYYAPSLMRKFIEKRAIGAAFIQRAMRTLLQSPVISPAKLVRSLEADIKLLPILWPMLTESVNAAGAVVAAGNNASQWVNRILDIALRYAPYLKEAAMRGLIPPEDAKWTGLSTIASSKAKSAAVTKAKKLLGIL